MKTILTFALALIVSATLAQSKTDTPAKIKPVPVIEKPVYKLDRERFAHITVTFDAPIGVVDNFLFVEQNGGEAGLKGSHTITMADGEALLLTNRTVRDTINKKVYIEFQKYLDADKAKFTADTTAKFHPIIKK